MIAVTSQRLPLLPAVWRRPLAVLALLLAAQLLLYRETWAGMAGIWLRSDTFAHAVLVAPISLWLIWRRREHVLALAPRAAPIWLLPAAVMGALWLPGDMAGANALTQFTVVAMLVLLFIAVLGPQVARELAFPLGFLFFMVPSGEFLMPTFMNWTADFTVAALRITGVPVYREGLNFIIPSGSWSVVEACSGIRYLIASFMVGTLFAYLNFNSLRRRLLFCAVALVVPVVANWVRAYLIVMLGHLSSNRLATGVDHLVYGWLFFGLIVALMFMIGARWAEPAASPRPVPPAAAVPAGSQGAWVGLAALALLALPPVLRWQQAEQDSTALPALVLQLPALADAGDGTEAGFEPVFVNPSARALRSYALPGGTVHVHVAYYRQQGFERKLVSSDNMLVASRDPRWLRTDGGTSTDGADRSWRSAELREGGAAGAPTRRRLDVRQIYWVGGQHTDSDFWAVGLGVWNRLLGRGDDAAAITLFTEGLSATETAARLDQFTRRHLAAIDASLAAAMAAGRGAADISTSTRSLTPP